MVRNPLILASTSVYRRALLERLMVPFLTCSPEVEETPQPGESPRDLVLRLSEAKARAGAQHHPGHLIIGSDQVAVLEDDIIGKPGTHQKAVEQLLRAAGQEVKFLTGLCLFNGSTGRMQLDAVPFGVVFRRLDRETINRYLQREQPYDCAGSFKSEGLGIALFRRMVGDDPSALMGLPLIRLTTMLAAEGVQVP